MFLFSRIAVRMAESLERFESGIIAEQVRLGYAGGFKLEPSASDMEIDTAQAVIRDLGTTFSLSAYNVERFPVVVARCDGLSSVPIGITLNSLPIKFPGTGYRIPNELACIRNILQTCLNAEATIFPVTDDLYAYVSLQRSIVASGSKQGSSAIHSDDIQGPRIQPKTMAAHGYVAVDEAPTVFYPGAIDLTDLDVDTHNIAKAIEQRVDRTRKAILPLGSLALIDGYCIHEAGIVERTMPRTFFRLLFSPRLMDRAGNTYNELFAGEYRDHGWEFQPRPLPGGYSIQLSSIC